MCLQKPTQSKFIHLAAAQGRPSGYDTEAVYIQTYCTWIYLWINIFGKTQDITEVWISSIYYLSPDITNDSCELSSSTTWLVTILDAGDSLLSSNLDRLSYLHCNKHNSVWKPIPAYDYTVIKKSLLCDCQLPGGNEFLHEYLQGLCLPITNELSWGSSTWGLADSEPSFSDITRLHKASK